MKAYYQLAKPGIIYGNALTAVGGFLFASKGHVDFALLLALLSGLSLVIASACVLNNIIDRDIDRKMARTKNRAIATGLITAKKALLYAALLGLTGFFILAAWVNVLTVFLGLGAVFSYVVLYGLAKRRSVHGTLVGTIPGAASIVAGYGAAVNHLDGGVLVLFLILVSWQMAHFYSIAIYRLKDYKAAGIPVMPAIKGIRITKIYILIYVAGFIVAVLSLSVFGYSSFAFGLVMSLLGVVWLYRGIQGLKTINDTLWAKRMFTFSLSVILGLSVMLSLDSMLQ